MTLERPMFPPRGEQCRVIQFAAHARPAEKVGALAAFREVRRAQDEAKVAQLTTFPRGLTITGRNLRLRLERKKAWRAADRLTRWWRARIDWQFALEMAQSYDIGDSKTYASVVHGERFVLVDLWRTALVSQILTPAPDMGAVAWKRIALRKGDCRYGSVAPEALHKAIAEDVKWLKDHPSRRQIGRSSLTFHD
jgi:hypothetical protein